MKKWLNAVALLTVFVLGGMVSAAFSSMISGSMETVVMRVASYRCQYNGDVITDTKNVFAGLANLQSVQRTSLDTYTIVCTNGAHFYDRVRPDIAKIANGAVTSDPGSGKSSLPLVQ